LPIGFSLASGYARRMKEKEKLINTIRRVALTKIHAEWGRKRGDNKRRITM
jgi:hypothetical protein